MSANLKITADGQVSMAYAAGTETPWHGMGQIILPTDSDEIITKKCGFDPANVRMVTDKRATTQAIRERLRWLVTGLTAPAE